MRFDRKWYHSLKVLFPKLYLTIMSEDEQKAFDAAKAEVEALKKEKEEAEKNKNQPPKDTPPPSNETLDEQARRNAAEKSKLDAENKRIERAVKFSYDIKTVVKENLELVGDEIKNIVELADKRTYANAVEKANEVRATVLDAFFKQQKNVDALITESFKNKAIAFLALTQVKKNELADEYWELFELAVENVKSREKHEELVKQKKGENTDKSTEEHNQKFFNARSHYIKERK